FKVERATAYGRPAAEIVGAARAAALMPQMEAVLRGEAQQFERVDGDRTLMVHFLPDVVDGEVRGAFALALDVTELKAARDAALRGAQAKSDFLATMSHEMRTPLNGILSLLKLMLSEPLAPDARRFASLATVSGQTLLSLVNDLLDLSKIESGKLEIVPEDID